MAYYGGKENGALMAVNSAIEMLEYLKTSENPIMRKIKIRIGIKFRRCNSRRYRKHVFKKRLYTYRR